MVGTGNEFIAEIDYPNLEPSNVLATSPVRMN